MLKINGREATSTEVNDIVCALRAKAQGDLRCAENLRANTDPEAKWRERLASTLEAQAKRGNKLADAIEDAHLEGWRG